MIASARPLIVAAAAVGTSVVAIVGGLYTLAAYRRARSRRDRAQRDRLRNLLIDTAAGGATPKRQLRAAANDPVLMVVALDLARVLSGPDRARLSGVLPDGVMHRCRQHAVNASKQDRYTAIAMLGAFGTPGDSALLTSLLHDPDQHVRARTANALSALRHTTGADRHATIAALIARIGTLTSTTDDIDKLVVLLGLLASTGDTTGEPACIEAAAHPDADVRSAAANALAVLATVEGSTVLRQLAADPDPAVRESAISALDARLDAHVVDVFTTAAGDSDPRVASRAVRALIHRSPT